MGRAVEAHNLYVSYNGTPALDNVSITVDQGEFLSVLGPNGSGKTTLIKALTGIIKDIKGEVLLFNRPLWWYRRRDFARFISFLPQNPPVTLPFMVKDIVLMGRFPYLKRFQLERPHDNEACEHAMELMGITHLAHRHLMELSGGEIKRVFIAQAIAQESNILFLDEPTANLDINYQIEIFKMLKKFNEEMNKTIVLITHDINHAARFTRRIILLKNGQIVRTGDASRVINRKDLKFVFGTDIRIEYDRQKKPYILI
ncbi:MAG: ABC transporter ATP-binding protein [Spirochaetota bacterium]